MKSAGRLPSRVLFVTPYAVEVAALETRFEKIESLRARQVKVIDGEKLARLVHSRIPDVARRLGAPHLDLSSATRQFLNNEPLMNALNARVQREITTFYTDIDFTVGKWTTRLFFSSELRPITKQFSLPQGEWDSLAEVCRHCREHFSVELLCEPESLILSRCAQQRVEYAEWRKKVRDPQKQKADNDAKLRELDRGIETSRSILKEYADKIDSEKSRLQRVIDDARKAITIQNGLIERARTNAEASLQAQQSRHDQEEVVLKAQFALNALPRHSFADYNCYANALQSYRNPTETTAADHAARKKQVTRDLKAWEDKLCEMEDVIGLGAGHLHRFANEYLACVDALVHAEAKLSQLGPIVPEH